MFSSSSNESRALLRMLQEAEGEEFAEHCSY